MTKATTPPFNMKSSNIDVTVRTTIVTLALFLICACQKDRPGSIHRSEPYPANRTIDNGGVIVAGIRKEPESLSPLFALSQSARNIISLIFSRLADINEDLSSFSPRLAKSWDVSEEKHQITFHLRTDVFWHDGMRFTARDVIRSYQLHTDPVIAWDGIAYKQNISSVEAPNDSTVIFTFKTSSRTMLMDAVEGFILPAHLMDMASEKMFTDTFNQHPIGTGPFRFYSWDNMQSITLVKNENYYMPGKPHLDRIIFQIIPDNFSLLNGAKSGEIDLIEGIFPRDFQMIVKEWDSGKSALRPISYLGRRYDFIGWNLIDPGQYRRALKNGISTDSVEKFIAPNPLFGNQDIRAALTMALDRNAISNTVNHGMAVPLNGPIPPILPAYNKSANNIWDYDPERAVEILAKQGWVDTDDDNIIDKNGVPFEFELLTESGNLRWEQVATIVQDQLGVIGIKVNPRFIEPALLYGKLLPAKDFDAVIIGWSVGLTPDFSPLFHSGTFFTPFHFTGYYSKEYDRLDRAAKMASTDKIAQKYYDDIARLLSNELPYTWLYYRLECSAVHSRFKNIVYDKRGLYVNPEDWWIPREERRQIDRLFEK